MFSWYVARVFSKWLWNSPSRPYYYWQHLCFHMPCISIVRSLDFRIFSASFLITFLSPEIATSINIHVPLLLSQIKMSGLLLRIVLSVCSCWFHNMVTLLPWLVSTDSGTCSYQCFFVQLYPCFLAYVEVQLCTHSDHVFLYTVLLSVLGMLILLLLLLLLLTLSLRILPYTYSRYVTIANYHLTRLQTSLLDSPVLHGSS